MSHYAKIQNNIVTEVIVAERDFIQSGAVGDPSMWVQTSYNNNIRGRYAGIGYVYLPEQDVFLTPKPFPSWILATGTAQWRAPVDPPADADTVNYAWNELSQSWDQFYDEIPGE